MAELLLVDDVVAVWREATGIGNYDFDFRSYFPCKHPLGGDRTIDAVARIGAIEDYDRTYRESLDEGICLVHSPEEHRRASELSEWYPLLEDLTPSSRVYALRPTGREVADDFRFPVFVKGARQTSRHRRSLSIIGSEAEFDAAMMAYGADPILSWQPVVVREFVPLRRVEDPVPDRVPSSFEFRTFWWHGELIGAGRYWWQGKPYDWSDAERREALAVAAEAARRIAVPFLVVDVAMTWEGAWIVVECNDGQESGYAGASALGIWQRVVDLQCRL